LAASPPIDPIPNKENVITCHSERSEESTIFYRTTIILNIYLHCYSGYLAIEIGPFLAKRTDFVLNNQ